MLVRVQHGTGEGRHGLSSAEEAFVTMTHSWGPGAYHLPGLALVNVNVPDKNTTRQVDALLFTPTGLIVIEIKGFTRPQAGTLTVPANGPWRVDDEPAALHTHATGNPGEQVKAGVYAAKTALAGIDEGGGTFVTGLVVLTRLPGQQLTLGDTRQAGRGIRVTLATPTDVRRLLHQHRRRRTCWTATGVHTACHTLALDHLAPTTDELRADGFPDDLPPAPTPQTRQHRPRGPAPSSSPSSPRAAPPVAPHRPAQPTPTAAPQPPQQHGPAAPPPPAPAARQRRVPWATIIVILLIIAATIAGSIAIEMLFAGR